MNRPFARLFRRVDRLWDQLLGHDDKPLSKPVRLGITTLEDRVVPSVTNPTADITRIPDTSDSAVVTGAVGESLLTGVDWNSIITIPEAEGDDADIPISTTLPAADITQFNDTDDFSIADGILIDERSHPEMLPFDTEQLTDLLAGSHDGSDFLIADVPGVPGAEGGSKYNPYSQHWHHLYPKQVFENLDTGVNINAAENGYILFAKDHIGEGGIHPTGWNSDWAEWVDEQQRRGLPINAETMKVQLAKMMELEKYKSLFAGGEPATESYGEWTERLKEARKEAEEKAARKARQEAEKVAKEGVEDVAGATTKTTLKKAARKLPGVGMVFGLFFWADEVQAVGPVEGTINSAPIVGDLKGISEGMNDLSGITDSIREYEAREALREADLIQGLNNVLDTMLDSMLKPPKEDDFLNKLKVDKLEAGIRIHVIKEESGRQIWLFYTENIVAEYYYAPPHLMPTPPLHESPMRTQTVEPPFANPPK